MPKHEKMNEIDNRDLIKGGNQKNHTEQEEEASKSSNKKGKNHKRAREDESLEQIKRQRIAPEMICQETIDNQSTVQFYSQEAENSKDSIVTVILPTEEAGSPSKPDLSSSPSLHHDFFPIDISDQEMTKELEVD